jgi:hypothetical protein
MDELCQQLEWNFVKAASNFSSYTGLAASMVLASMVIVVVQYKGEENTAGPLALFTITLLALGSDTFMFGAANGDAICSRAGTQGMLASSTMGVGVVVLLAGITALQSKFKRSLSELSLVGSVVTNIGAIGVLGLIALWSVRFVNTAVALRLRPGPPVSYLPALVLIGLFVGTAAVIAVVAPGERARRRAITIATLCYLLHIVAVTITYLITLVLPLDQWTVQASPVMITATIGIAVGLPVIELTAILISVDWRTGRGQWRRLLSFEEGPTIPAQQQAPVEDSQREAVRTTESGQ